MMSILPLVWSQSGMHLLVTMDLIVELSIANTIGIH